MNKMYAFVYAFALTITLTLFTTLLVLIPAVPLDIWQKDATLSTAFLAGVIFGVAWIFLAWATWESWKA